ncbi:MAG: hypothetical protein R3F29_10645 [Planctomycetota bacterium]
MAPQLRGAGERHGRVARHDDDAVGDLMRALLVAADDARQHAAVAVLVEVQVLGDPRIDDQLGAVERGAILVANQHPQRVLGDDRQFDLGVIAQCDRHRRRAADSHRLSLHDRLRLAEAVDGEGAVGHRQRSVRAGRKAQRRIRSVA